jgi:hypothetical protein
MQIDEGYDRTWKLGLMIKPPSQAAHSEWIMMGPAHSWCQCGQLSLCSNSLVVQPRWGAGAGGGSGWAAGNE